MNPFPIEPATISQRVAAVAALSRNEAMTEADNLVLLEALRGLMGEKPLTGGATVEDALALVTMAREFFKCVSTQAAQIDPAMVEENPLVFFSGRMDNALAQAIHILENVAGQSSSKYAWGAERVAQ